MRLILSGAAIFAALFTTFAAQPMSAQSIRAIGGPAETPSAYFQGQQYVDSRGCVFMRAGLGGKISWVARIGQDRRPICNDVSMAEAAARLAAPETVSQTTVVAQPSTKAVGKPMATVASNMRVQSQVGVQTPIVVPGLASVAASAPVAKVATSAPKDVAQPRSARCPAAAPVLQQMALQSGGTVLVCTRGDGTATGWLSPGYPAGVGGTIENVGRHQVAYSGNVAPSSRQTSAAEIAGANVQTVIAGAPVANPPVGQTQYVAAWKDGRLNPLRGKGTAEGWAMQGQIWTQKSPAKLVVTQPVQKTQRFTQSTMSAGQTVKGGARYVQVGTFGNPNNVANVAGALSAMGLPVSKSRMTKAGRDLVIVFAGPFDSAQAAQAALGMTHQAGFGDAFLR